MNKIHDFLYELPTLIKLLPVGVFICMSYFYVLELTSYENVPFYTILFFIVAVLTGMMFRKPKDG